MEGVGRAGTDKLYNLSERSGKEGVDMSLDGVVCLSVGTDRDCCPI